MDVTKLTKDLNDEDLAALNEGIQAEIRNRGPKVDQALLDRIKPGMSKEEDAAVRTILQQAAKDFL
jgi:hypothetical protein